ncbi:hypothetical protein R3P38DRAFT_276526 [Favolaschia claudopus]|uniref:Nephrocystin 3-like N-terminal domain-containing protein n=1 Tax=Favolaschia claudopus TaxID=2862362 RepID=A0AAV9ZQL1_9AGAR
MSYRLRSWMTRTVLQWLQRRFGKRKPPSASPAIKAVEQPSGEVIRSTTGCGSFVGDRPADITSPEPSSNDAPVSTVEQPSDDVICSATGCGSSVGERPADIPPPEPSSNDAPVLQPISADDRHKTPAQLPEYLSTLKSGFTLLLKRTGEVLDGTPFKIPLSAVNTLIDVANVVSENRSNMRTLLNNISRQLDSINAASSLTTSIESKQWIREFSENLKREFDIISAIREKGIPNQILKSDDNVKVIEEAIRNIDDHFKAFLLNLIIAMDRKLDHATVAAAIQILHAAASTEASYNSGDSYDRPSCHPQTRAQYFSKLNDWSSQPGPGVLWMFGPAGTGKSSIAQTFCTQLQDEHRLGASFFFKRGHVSRKNAMKLFPTLAYHLALACPEFQVVITQVLGRNPSVIDQPLSMQFQSLIAEPYQQANLTLPLVLVIDGLDECDREDLQQEIIRTFNRSQLSFRVLIVSRLEPHIEATWEEPCCQGGFCMRVGGSVEDIRAYLTFRLENIRVTHQSMHLTPSPWPDTEIVEQLVDQSSGHFIYASTVIRFLEDEDASPVEGLELLLTTHVNVHGSESPLAALDGLYLQILNMVAPANRVTVLQILSIIAEGLRFSPVQLAWFLQINDDQVRRAMRRLYSVLDIYEDSRSSYLVAHHASFIDFLRDPGRSRDFAVTDDLQHWLALAMAKAYSERRISPLGPFVRHLDLEVITKRKALPDIIEQLHHFNPDLLFGSQIYHVSPVKMCEHVLNWLKDECASETLIKEWQDYMSLIEFNNYCNANYSTKTLGQTSESPPVQQHPDELLRIVQVNLVLGFESQNDVSLYTIRRVLDYSWEDMRSFLLPICSKPDSEREALLMEALHPSCILRCFSDETQWVIAKQCLELAIEDEKHPAWFPFWSFLLRACSPSQDLLQCIMKLAETDELGELERVDCHNIRSWLKTNRDCPKALLRHSRTIGGLYDWQAEYVDNSWEDWRQRTGLGYHDGEHPLTAVELKRRWRVFEEQLPLRGVANLSYLASIMQPLNSSLGRQLL